MSLFICDKCGVIENTALGNYWSAKFNEQWNDESLNGLALCSICAPPTYADGSNNRNGGGWHGKFNREFPNKSQILSLGLNSFVYTEGLQQILNSTKYLAT